MDDGGYLKGKTSGSAVPDSFYNLMEPAPTVRGGVPVSTEDAPLSQAQIDQKMEEGRKAMEKGIPLTVAESAGNMVELEDPDGLHFSVPREWIKENVEEFGANDTLKHTSINAPKGELEKIWRMATAASDQDGDPGGFGGEDYVARSILDRWNAGELGKPLNERAVNSTDSPEGAFTPPTPAAASSAFSASRRQLQRQNPTNVVPPNAGSGWGNWNQVWNASKRRWDTQR